LLPEAKNIVKNRKYISIPWFWASDPPKTSVSTVFFAPRVAKTRENSTYLTIFGHYGTEKKAAGAAATTTTAAATTTTTRSQCSLPDPNSNLWIGVTPAGPQPRGLDQSVARRTSTTKDLQRYTR